MRCPFCNSADTQVKDSRPSDDGMAIRRRRFCPQCDSRFTTFERVQLRDLTVIKRNGQKKPLDRDKITRSILIATRKRPVSNDQVERLAGALVRQLEKEYENEVPASRIGELIMDGLREVDKVAYIRYASVYKDFRETRDFEDLIGSLAGKEE